MCIDIRPVTSLGGRFKMSKTEEEKIIIGENYREAEAKKRPKHEEL